MIYKPEVMPAMSERGYTIQNKEIRFEVTNMCNANCVMCPREKMTRTQGILDMGLYIRTLDEACSMGATVVSLENFGETFMDPFFFERAAYAKGKGMKVLTITNGSLFNKRAAERSIYFIDKIRFSVYGTTKDVYEPIHRGLKYDTVIENVEYLLDLKKRSKSAAPKVEVYFLYMDQNKHQAEEFKKKWMGRVDDIAMWKPHNWSDGRSYRKTGEGRKKVTCGRPNKGPIQVQWDGLVVPCCFDYNSSIVLGDLKKQTLRQVLESKEYNAFRKAHAEGSFSQYPFCESCDQLLKREDVLVFTTIKDAKVGAVNTTYDKVD